VASADARRLAGVYATALKDSIANGDVIV